MATEKNAYKKLSFAFDTFKATKAGDPFLVVLTSFQKTIDDCHSKLNAIAADTKESSFSRTVSKLVNGMYILTLL